MSDLAPETREEAYLSALANDGTVNLEPKTRKEAILQCAINGTLPSFEPETREEAYLVEVCKKIAGGGSGGGEDAERTVVLEENGVNVFFGECTLDNEVSFDFIQEGVEYTVVWDGTEYTCVGTLSGNYLSLGGNDEPFTLWYNVVAKESEINVEDDGYYTFMVYQNGASDSLDVEQIDEIVEALFANGDMVITAPDGKLYKNVTIEKPDTLVPENIAKDVNIAGVVGTLSGGGSGGDGEVDPVTVSYRAMIDGSLKDGIVREITLPNGLTTIMSYCFSGYSSLNNVIFPPTVKTIMSSAFNNCGRLALTSLPEGITSIKAEAFRNCTSLALTSLPNGLPFLSDGTFYNCTSLALTSLPEGIGNISSEAFYNCTSLALTSIPEGVNNVYRNAFKNCTGLTTITFKGKPNSIASNAFDGCTNLTTINVPWAEGEVANAPWGATNATINYNYTGE